MTLILSFQGNDADQHHVEAFSGARSLAGLSRSLALVANYASTGRVRYRYPFDENLQFFIEGATPGSLNWKLALVGVGGPLALGLGTNAVYDLGKLVITRAVGVSTPATDPQVQHLDNTKGGDIEALVEAAEPALKEAHYGIGDTIQQVVIINGNNNTPIVKLDRSTKDYLNTTIPAQEDRRLVSVSALNANDKTGRIYLADLGRTVPFKISSRASGRTIVNLSRGLQAYTQRTGELVDVQFQPLEASDGRLKRVVIYDAKFVELDVP